MRLSVDIPSKSSFKRELSIKYLNFISVCILCELNFAYSLEFTYCSWLCAITVGVETHQWFAHDCFNVKTVQFVYSIVFHTSCSFFELHVKSFNELQYVLRLFFFYVLNRMNE